MKILNNVAQKSARYLFGLVYRTGLVLDLSNKFLLSFTFIFVSAPNAASFLFLTASPCYQRFARNYDSMNRIVMSSEQAILEKSVGGNSRI